MWRRRKDRPEVCAVSSWWSVGKERLNIVRSLNILATNVDADRGSVQAGFSKCEEFDGPSQDYYAEVDEVFRVLAMSDHSKRCRLARLDILDQKVKK